MCAYTRAYINNRISIYAHRTREYRGTRGGREIKAGLSSCPAINDNILRTTIETSRTLPACCHACSARCEREPRSLLIISSRISNTADSCSVMGHFFVHSANIVHVKPSEVQPEGILYYSNPYPSIQSRRVTLTGRDRPMCTPTMRVRILVRSDTRA